MHMEIERVSFALRRPFAITGHVFETTETIRVTLSDGAFSGQGEAVGVYYLGETPESIVAQLSGVADALDGLTGERIQSLLPPGGARNALDCAFWDYRAKATGRTIWELFALPRRELVTVYTLGIAEPALMAERAAAAASFPKLKVKLDGNKPIERLEAVRTARPDAALIVDVNQGWTLEALEEYLPHCERLGVAMIEQPLPRGADEALDVFRSPVPLGADESCLHLGEFAAASRRYQVLNIKLDKCGGLTEGLALVAAARRAGMDIMVGNMMGSSLSMAPSHVIGQYCRFVDIDGPLLLAKDVANGLWYRDGGIVGPPDTLLWG